MSFIILLSAFFPYIVLGQQPANDCTSFTSNGIASSTFQYYRFYDFRNITSDSSSTSSAPSSPARSKTTTDSSWKKDWYIRDYPKESAGGTSIPVDFTPDQVTITNSTDNSKYYSTFLTLATARESAQNQSAAEITYAEYNISHASIRVYSRVRGAPGAVAGIFTYLNDTQESDIEILTRDPNESIQYTNQPSDSGSPNYTPITGATVNVTLPKKLNVSEWIVHRLDWTPQRTVTFANEIQTGTSTVNVPVAEEGTRLYLDMWGANSSWSGDMEVGGSAGFDVQWIEVLFNTSDSGAVTDLGTKKCAIGSVDSEAVRESGTGRERVSLGGILGMWVLFVLAVWFG